MFVKVLDDGSVSMIDVHNFSKFAVIAPRGVDTGEALVRSSAGYRPDTDARIRVEWMRARAEELSLSSAWHKDFEGMLKYAASKNWLNDDGTITAHVEVEE